MTPKKSLPPSAATLFDVKPRPSAPSLLKKIVCVICVICVICGQTTVLHAADIVLLDGRILTVDQNNTEHEAIAIEGNRILAVGTSDEISKHIESGTRVIRLEGRTVIPGLIETHCHAIGVARASLGGSAYKEFATIPEIQNWLRKRATEIPPGTWIRVPRCPITRIAERRHPTVAELDAACPNHPVVFTAALKDAVNSLGLEKLGIIDGEAPPKGVKIARDGEGNIRVLIGAGALVRNQVPPAIYTDKQTEEAVIDVLRLYNEVGITSIFERATDIAGYRLYRKLRDEEKLTVRATMTFRKQTNTAEGLRKFVDELRLKPREGDDWVRAATLKITVDGGIHWGTTRLSEPYGEKRNAFYVLDNPEYRGDLSYSVEEMTAVFGEAHRLGWQMSCHVTGDAGVESVLDALAALDTKEDPVAKHRFNLIHAYFPTPRIIERGKELGVGVDTQSYLYYKDSDAIAEVYGKRWAEMLIGAGSWFHGGIPVALNSDHMIGLDPNEAMNAYNPFLMLYIAVTRKNERGIIYGEHQKLSRLEALRCVTANAAWLSFDENVKGSLQPGKLADLAVLDRDYLACPEEEIRQIKPTMTMVDGKFVHEK